MADPLGTDVETLRSLACGLCDVSKVLQDSDMASLFRLCEITKAQVKQQIAHVISNASAGAMLQMAFADGTPTKTTEQYRQQELTGFRHRRAEAAWALLSRISATSLVCEIAAPWPMRNCPLHRRADRDEQREDHLEYLPR